MNDLDLLTELGNETPLPDPASLAPARARVVAGLTAQRRRPSRRTVITGSVVAATAAAVAAAAVTLSTLAPASHPTPRAGGNVTAAQLLDLAAAAAVTQQPVIPKPDQYVYSKEVTGGLVTQVWTPVDDNLSGLIKEGNQAPAVTSEERPGFYPGMPTSASAMPGFFAGLGVDVHDIYFVHLATEILSNDYLLPTQRAAFYKFLATVQGSSVASDVRDAAGRPGTGLVWTVQGVKWMLIFDSRTFAYLGVKLGDGSGQAGWIISEAQLQKAIVNRPGQLP
jgi:hypothetical protein